MTAARTSSPSIVGVLLVCLALRLALFFVFHPWDPRVESEHLLKLDAVGYHQLALSLLTLHRFESGSPPTPNALRTPGYPLFLASVYLLAGIRPWVALLVQIAMDAVGCLLLYSAASRLFGRRVGIVAALLYAVDPYLILYSSSLLISDSLFVFLLVVMLWFCSRAITEKTPGRILALHGAACVFLGFAALTRPVAVYALPVYALFCTVLHRRSPGRAVVAAAVCVLAFTATIAPWLLRNFEVFGSPSLSTSGQYNALVLDVAPMVAVQRHMDTDAAGRQLLAEADRDIQSDGLQPQHMNPFERARYWERAAQRYVRQDPSGFAKAYTRGVLSTLFNVETTLYSEILGHPVASVDIKSHEGIVEMMRNVVRTKGAVGVGMMILVLPYLFLSYLTGAWGLLVGWRNYDRAACVILAIFAAYFIVVTGPAGFGRFRLPSIPFYLPLVALGVVEAVGRRWPNAWRAKETPTPG